MRLSGPMDRFCGTAHIVRAGHAEAPAARQLSDTLAPSAGLLNSVETFAEAVTVHHQIVERARRRTQQISPANGEGIELERARHAIEQAFESMPRVDGAMSAH